MPNRPQPRLLQALFIAGAGLWLASKPKRPVFPLLWSALLFVADLVAIPLVLRAKSPISAAELGALKPGQVPVIDRLALHLPVARRETIRKSSDKLLRVMVAAPGLLLFLQRFRRNSGSWLPEYAWGHALTYTIYTFSPLGPAFADKYRPVVYRNAVPFEERVKGNNRNSQYSGHTGNAAFAAFFLAELLRPRNGTSCRSTYYIIAALSALILGSLRVRAQKHFPTDVLLATGIGAIFALHSARRSCLQKYR